jgi:outer membrane protein insertion porin family
MLDEGGHSVKSSIKHVWSRDSRNDGLIPTIGSAVRISNELAGLGGSVRFIKSEVDVQHNVPLTPTADWSLSFLGKAGVHVPFGGSRSHISDRFFVGGPGSFRGFGAKGLGPRYKHDSYGGDVFWNASAHLIGLLRDVNNLGLFYGHLFAQAGNNVRLPQWRQVVVGSGKPGNGDEVRTSVGAGVVWRMPVGARVEFNYVWPLNAQPNDVQNPGPQVGMSVAFL